MEMVRNSFSFIMIGGIVLGIVFSVFSTRSTKGRHFSVIYLNLMILFLSLNNLQLLLSDNDLLGGNFFLHKMLIPWYMLIMPSFYTFLMYYLKVENKIYSFVRLSVILFLTEILVRLVMMSFYLHDNENFLVATYSQYEEIFNAVFTLFLFTKSSILVFNYSNRFDFVSSFDNLRWLKIFIFLGCLEMLMWVCAIVINLDKVLYPAILVYYPLRLCCSIILYWIGYQGFFNYNIMTQRIAIREQIISTTTIADDNNQEDELAQREQVLKHFETIENFMQNNQDYLQPDFSLQKLSDTTRIPVNRISFVINNCSGCNFSDYINQYRVTQAKNLLLNQDFENYDIASIAFECGYNSKSAFYNAFAKFTNLTPAKYKNQNKS